MARGLRRPDDDAPASGLVVFVRNGADANDPGDLPAYRITVVNASDAPVLQMPLHDARPAALHDALWRCTAGLGGTCQPNAGDGDLATTVNLPPGAQAALERSARVGAFAPELVYRVAPAMPIGYDDPDADDNIASDIDVVRTVFRDGFD